jgi:hypothetical protein
LRELKRLIKKKFYFTMQLQKQSLQDRKQDARKKIMLGGLFVKAGLDHFHPHDPATLYGMLLDAKAKMQCNPTLQDKWRAMGKELMINN